MYDIPGIRNSLFAELTSNLDLYDPEIGLVPPAEQGRTFVQWPTWMFLENPLEEEAVYTTNAPTNTFRLDLRATLLRVEWRYGDTVVANCTSDQMEQYLESSHPIDDLPACNHTFTEAGSADLTTTIYYKIEEKIRTRPSGTLDAWPEIPWDDYLGTPTVFDLESTIADYGVHEILAVNVFEDTTADEARAILAATD